MKPGTTIWMAMVVIAWLLIFPSPGTSIEISDEPMDSIVEAAPPNLMIILDDSGSMDWEYTIQGADNGLCYIPGTTAFYGYLYGNPGDNNYNTGTGHGRWPGYNAATEAHKRYWMPRTNAHNRTFYNPETSYMPWPGHDENGDPFVNADLFTPRSNPFRVSPTFDIRAEYDGVDNHVVIDNVDPGAEPLTGTWTTAIPADTWGVDAHRTTTQGGRFQWTLTAPATGEYYVEVWYPSSDTNANTAEYIIQHAGGEFTSDAVNQRNNTGQWIKIAGPLTFNAGMDYAVIVEKINAAPANATVHADAVRLRWKDISIKRTHYYIWKDISGDGELSDENAYLVNFNEDGSRSYYLLSEDAVTSGRIEGRQDLIDLTELPEEVRPAWRDADGEVIAYLTDAEDLQNFANWYSFYRKRDLTAKAAVGRTITGLDGDIRLGLYSINPPSLKASADHMARFPVRPVYTYTHGSDGVIIIHPQDNNNAHGGVITSSPARCGPGGCNDANRWRASTTTSGAYGGREFYTRNNSNAWFRWTTPSIPTSQTYEIYVWYNSAQNRDPGAVYRVGSGGTQLGGDEVIDQRHGGGQWVRLSGGPFFLTEGQQAYVEVRRGSASNSVFTCADAVMFAPTSTGVSFDWDILDQLYTMTARGATPLRMAFNDVGRYFDNSQTSTLGPSPWLPEADGGSCQQSFVIVMTDGYWNDTGIPSGGNLQFGGIPGNGNADGNKSAPFADDWSNTLADIAMYYYDNDLAPELPNEVPRYSCDHATHQHLVTYGVSFGLTGHIDQGDGKACTLIHSGANVAWPNPRPSNDYAGPAKIDDLYHATVNGRGAFFTAFDPEELARALIEIVSNISSRRASGASVSVQGDELSDGTMIYQTTFRTGEWIGDVRAYKIDKYGTVSDAHEWSAAEKIGSLNHETRRIITFDPLSETGIPFHFDELRVDQQTHLGGEDAGPLVLDFLRGRTDNIGEHNFRYRYNILGDIVHSSPYLFGDSIYAGGNDGMLHVFNKETGEERFAYVPNLVFENLAQLADPGYQHRFYVDLTPYARKYVLEGSPPRTLLVGGLGKGGKGYYALDITDVDNWDANTPESTIASAALWEYDGAALDDDDLGYTFSEAWIVRTYAYNDDGYAWSVIFGNGYNSINGHAVLYVLDARTGHLVKKIDTGAGGDNGLSTPVVVDATRNGIIDYVYAGDLNGNLWKFDLTIPKEGEDRHVSGAAPEDYWGSAYGVDVTTLDSRSIATGAVNAHNSSGDIPIPLFRAEGQPITSKPAIASLDVCHPGGKGFLVVFGTGKYLGLGDRACTDQQTIYGIWDYGDDEDPHEYVGSFDPVSKTWSDRPYFRDYVLVEQYEVFAVHETTAGTEDTTADLYGEFGVLTDHTVDWSGTPDIWGPNAYSGNPDPNVNAGWFFNLPICKERVFKDAIIRGKIAIFISFIPGESLCSGGGDSILNELNLCTGGRTDRPVMDIDDDGRIDSKDQLRFLDEDGNEITAPAQRRAYGGLLHVPKIIEGPEELKYFSTSAGTIIRATEAGERQGIYFWREF